MTKNRSISFSLHPDLLSRQLGADMYSAAEALKQLVANALDSDCGRVDVRLYFNELGAPERVTISDDGVGISPEQMGNAFRAVGVHVSRGPSKREPIGSRGIGRFGVFSLSVESRWRTVSQVNGHVVQQTWTMVPGRKAIEVTEETAVAGTGTVVDMTLKHREDVKRLFASAKNVKRILFNAFAAYLARYEDDVSVCVDDEPVRLDDFVDERHVEQIDAEGEIPSAELHHMVLGQNVDQPAPSLLVFATKGTTVSHEILGDEGIPGRKYFGLVDSPYLQELTNTAKSDLAEFDSGFRALKSAATDRAKRFISERQGEHAKAFLERARSKPYYPYQSPPTSPVDHYRRQLYDGLLLTLEEQYKIDNVPAGQQKLIFSMTRQLMQSEDLATVLTSVLGLEGPEVARFAALLRRTSLSSIIAVADLLVDRLRFLDELEVLVYGAPASWVRERKHLHKIIERHTWIFGEQFHLMGSDRNIDSLLAEAVAQGIGEAPGDSLAVQQELRDIPDLYLARSQWNEGVSFTRFSGHLETVA